MVGAGARDSPAELLTSTRKDQELLLEELLKLDLRRHFKLSKYDNIFQTEVFAVRKVAEIANNARNDIKIINIYINSQAAISECT